MAYQTEPTFANSKIITSLFNDRLEHGLGDNFKTCVEFKDITTDKLNTYKDQFDFNDLIKMSIDYSDAVIESEPNIDKELIDYVSQKNIPLLKYSEDYVQSFKTLYDQLSEK